MKFFYKHWVEFLLVVLYLVLILLGIYIYNI